jgi:transcriptional regulator with XRE-family HTH domain
LVEPTPTPAPTPSASLARRLRELRRSRFPDAKLTQGDVAQALSEKEPVAVSTLSAWENVRTPTLPSHERLASYARFFATVRSVEGKPPRLVPVDELSEAEDEARKELERELFRLRDDDAGEAPSPHQSWRFEDSAPVTIICSELSKSDRVVPPLSDVDNPNYTRLYSFADLDALVELLGHLYSSNPSASINYPLASQVTSNDLINHIVLLGGIAWNDVTRRLNASVELPVRQVKNEKIHSGEVFEIEGGPNHGEQFMPRWQEGNPGTAEKPGVLVEDVAMLARLPNPFNARRTLTYCNGIHSRGVLGAVRCLTDSKVRDDNESYLEETFRNSDHFVILMRVPVLGSQTISPSLRNPGAVLFQWPDV